MIEAEDYKFPHHEEPQREPTDEQRRQAAKTLAYMEALPWRPFTEEW